MDLACIYAALSIALSSWEKFSFLVFLQVLIKFLRPDIVDVGNRVKIVATEDILASYDFVVVGAGSAGAVVANRLSENANWSVLLLEAGGSPPEISDIPLFEMAFQRTDIDWQFKTEPLTTACLGMDNNQCRWPRGKVLGGTSVLNYMMHVRGNRKDFDQWKDLGNTGWGYDDVLPYFIKLENVSIPSLRNSSYRGTKGYLSIEEPRIRSPLADKYLEAAVELGYDLIDYNGETQMGYGYTQNTLKDGLRCSTEKTYLRPVSHRKNLHVSTESMVEKILIEKTTKATYGVQFSRDGKVHTVHIDKEVILSAGSVQSPQLLMLSGIGPKKHLKEVGVKVIHDSPGVGQNLQDHIAITGLTYLYDAVTEDVSTKSTGSKSSGLVPESVIHDFLNKKNGSLYSFTGGDANGFFHTGLTNDSLDYPDVQMMFASAGDNMGAAFYKRGMGLEDSFSDKLWKNIYTNNSFMIVPKLLHPKSRGNITLRNADPYEPPVIIPNYLSEKYDVDALVKASQLTYALSQTAAMRKFNPRPNPNLTPGCGRFNATSYKYFECLMRHYTFNAHHPVGTCKMGVADDRMAVVDPTLKVYGVTGLRVIDASIMPRLPSGNTNTPIIMIGEKGSDLVKADHAEADCSE